MNAVQVEEAAGMVLLDQPDLLERQAKSTPKAPQKVISIRLSKEDQDFIESVRGDLLPGEAVKKIIWFLRNIDHSYTRNTILKAEK